MRIVNRYRTKLFLGVATLTIALSFVLDPRVSVSSRELQASPAGPSQEDLTGIWRGDDKGTYYVRQVGNTLWWMGQSQDGGVSYTNLFNGNRNGDQITGFWVDVPAGKHMGSGSLTLSISGTGGNVEIRKVNETGGFGPSLWKRRGAAPQPPPPGVCKIEGKVINDKPQYATRIRLHRPDGSETPFSARVHGETYIILNVPEGTYEVRGTGTYPRGTTPSGRPTGLGIFVDSPTLTCSDGQSSDPVNFEIRNIEG